MKPVKSKRGQAGILVISFVVLVALFFVSINLGSLKVSFPQLFHGLFISYDETVAAIYDLRFPRILIAMMAGAALSVSGVLFQAVLKNPLADPGIIGISSGASFAAVLVTMFLPQFYFFTPLLACLGGILACVIVYTLSWKSGLSAIRMILVGVAVNAMFTGLMEGINAMSGGNATGAAAIVNANISMKTWEDVRMLFVYVIVGLLGALLLSYSCNLLALEDKTAQSLGIHVNRSRILISIVAVLLASITTALAGVISFLALIVPHIARLLVGSDHKILLPFSMLLGAIVLLAADTAGRILAAPYEISASILMAVIGGPIFILLLKRSTSTYGS